MLHFVHQLISNCACLLYVDEQVVDNGFLFNSFLQLPKNPTFSNATNLISFVKYNAHFCPFISVGGLFCFRSKRKCALIFLLAVRQLQWVQFIKC